MRLASYQLLHPAMLFPVCECKDIALFRNHQAFDKLFMPLWPFFNTFGTNGVFLCNFNLTLLHNKGNLC